MTQAIDLVFDGFFSFSSSIHQDTIQQLIGYSLMYFLTPKYGRKVIAGQDNGEHFISLLTWGLFLFSETP